MTVLAEPEDVLVETCDPRVDEAKESRPREEYQLSVRDSARLPIPDAKVVISNGTGCPFGSRRGCALFREAE